MENLSQVFTLSTLFLEYLGVLGTVLRDLLNLLNLGLDLKALYFFVLFLVDFNNLANF
jgi:hypothetical protein